MLAALATQDPEAVSDGWLVILGVFVGFFVGRIVFGRRRTFRAGVAQGKADAQADASAAAVVSVVQHGATVDQRSAVQHVEHIDVDHRSAAVHYLDHRARDDVHQLHDVDDFDDPAAVHDDGTCDHVSCRTYVDPGPRPVGRLGGGGGRGDGAPAGSDDGGRVGAGRDHAPSGVGR